MKKNNLIPVAKSIAIVIGFILSAHGASADVFYWVGQTSDWHNPLNWSVDLKATDQVPGPEDHVILSTVARNTNITISADVHIASLYALDTRDYQIQGSGPITLSVGGSFYLPGGSAISGKLKVELLETFPQSTFVFSKKAALSLNFPSRKEKPPGDVNTLVKSGSCSFFTIVPNPTGPTCNGFNNGIAAVLEPVDGVGPFAYQWIGGPTTPVWNNRSAGTYTIIVTDLGQGGAPCNTDVFVNEPGPLTVFSMNANPPTCADGCDGTAAPLVIGGNGGYVYNWSSGETGFSASNLCATFTLSIEDNQGCQYDTTFVFTNIPDQITIDATVQGVICNGAGDGAISVLATGGTGALTYTWSGPNGFSDNTPNISNLEPGTYTIGIEDASNCIFTESFDIEENPEIIITPSQIDNLCADDADGSVSVLISGGLLPYVFSWVGPNGFISSNQNIQDLESGIYSLTVTDAAGCVVIEDVEITSPLPLAVDLVSTDVACSSETTGVANAMASGGTGPYVYAWTGPSGFLASGPNISNLQAGAYTLEVTDDNGCSIMELINISEPVEIVAGFDEVPITCAGNSNGGINLTVTGGTPPFSFVWSGPGAFASADQNISGLVAGSYNVIITDGNGCILSASYDLSNPLPLQASGVVTDESCSTGGDGSIILSITDGSPPYIFSWIGPSGFSSDQQDISGLSAGAYNLVLTDALGCTANFSFTVDLPLLLSASFSQVNNVCFGDADGAITTNPTSGNAPYTYLWIGPGGFISSAQNISGLVAGEYNLQLSDANGCSSFFSVEILEPAQITISRVITGVSCFGGTNGAISINVTGGTPGYTYQWAGPNGFSSTNEDISGIQAGMYEITVTDVNGCTRTRIFTVPSPADYVVEAIISDVICAGDSDGAIDINVVVGTGPFTYAWTGPSGFSATSQNIGSIPAGSYTVVVTGNLGCTTSETYTVSETSVIAVDAVINGVSCFGSTDGNIELTITGGIAPYSVLWSGPDGFSSFGEMIESLQQGTYSAVISDNTGCIQTFDFELTEPSSITGNFVISNPDCFGSNTGEISAQLIGGSPPYTFEWTGPDGFTDFGAALNGLQAGAYELTGTDINGCIYNETVNLTDPAQIIIDVEITSPSCLNANGAAEASATGGSGALTYNWLDAGGSILAAGNLLSNVGAGVYTVQVIDENGCELSEIVTLSDFTGTVDGLVGNATCFEGSDGFVDIMADGGLPPYSFLWSGPDGFSSTAEDISGLAAGTYIVSVTDANGCVYNQAFEVLEPEEISGNPIVAGYSCLGNDGAIDLLVSGGTPDFTISWTGPNGFTGFGSALAGLAAGVYNFSIEDANGCMVVDSVEMIEAPGIEVVPSVTHSLCGNANTGAVDIEISGGLPPYSVEWSGPNGFNSSTENISELAGGTYSLTITDNAGCTESFLIDVLQPESIEVDFNIVQPDCLFDNGSISATISGGTVTGNYGITWTDEFGTFLSVTTDISDLAPGVYVITVTDDNGCIIEEAITLTNPDISVSVEIAPVSCFGSADGGITLVLVEGLEPAVVSWTGPNGFTSDSFIISELQTGIYGYQVTDANGCVLVGQEILNEPDELTIMATLTSSCFGVESGAIEISILGGTAPYTQAWAGPNGFSDNSQNINDLPPGIYDVTVTDENACVIAESFEVFENMEITADFAVDSILCFGDSAGAITATVAGGIGPYSLAWQGPNGFLSAEFLINGLVAGTYMLTATDSFGCAASFAVGLTQPEEIETTVQFESPGCTAIGSPGSISLEVTGGTPVYSVMWTGPGGFSSGSFEISGLDAGEYTYTIFDAAGCGPLVGVVELFEATPILVDFEVSNPKCFGFSDGNIALVVSGGIAPYSLSWNGPAGFTSDEMSIDSLGPGVYSLIVSDDAGCNAAFDFELTQPEPIQVAVVDAIDASCNTSLDGSIEVVVSGGTEPYSYEWSGPNGFTGTTSAIKNLGHGTYELVVSDSNGCSIDQTVSIGFMIEVIANAGGDVVICPNDLPTFVTGTGENTDVFIWTNLEGDTISDVATLELNMPPGNYTYILSAGNGICTDQDTLVLIVNEIPLVDAGEDIDAFAEELFTLGGAPTSPTALTYLWTPSAEGNFVNTAANPMGFVIETTLFVVVVTDENGCQSSDSVLVNILPEVNITSGFTPNSDGVNDTWIIDNMELFPNNVVSVFNRWGALLYQASRYNAANAWDGTFESNPVPVGTYYYTIELNDPRFPEPFTGPITIYR